jgi:hypothetical protein
MAHHWSKQHNSKNCGMMLQMVQLGVGQDVEDAPDHGVRARGGEDNVAVEDDIEGLVALVASGGDEVQAAFMRAHGAPEVTDDAVAEDDPNVAAYTGGWPEERLSRPAHGHTTLTVKEVIYGLMRTAAGNIRQGPMDDMIKVIKAAMPQPNELPECGP